MGLFFPFAFPRLCWKSAVEECGWTTKRLVLSKHASQARKSCKVANIRVGQLPTPAKWRLQVPAADAPKHPLYAGIDRKRTFALGQGLY